MNCDLIGRRRDKITQLCVSVRQCKCVRVCMSVFVCVCYDFVIYAALIQFDKNRRQADRRCQLNFTGISINSKSCRTTLHKHSDPPLLAPFSPPCHPTPSPVITHNMANSQPMTTATTTTTTMYTARV